MAGQDQGPSDGEDGEVSEPGENSAGSVKVSMTSAYAQTLNIEEFLFKVSALLAGVKKTASVEKSKRITPKQRVAAWFLGVIVASLVPFFPLVVHNIDSRRAPDIYDLLGRGDLLVISIVFTIAALVELGLYWTSADRPKGSVLLMISAILLILAEGFWYGDIISQILGGGTVPTHAVSYGSLVFFALSILCSLRCVRLSTEVH